MKKYSVIFAIFIVSCAATPAKKPDDLKEMFVALGSIDSLNKKISTELGVMKAKHPENKKFLNCVDKEFSPDLTIEYIRPYLIEIYSQEDIRKINEFLKTPTGIKFAKMTKSPEDFKPVKSYFSDEELIELTSFGAVMNKYSNSETNLRLKNASVEGGLNLLGDIMVKCKKHLKN